MPWVPIFVVAIALLHPILGAVAATSALLLFALALLNNRLTKNLVNSALGRVRCRSGLGRQSQGQVREVVGPHMGNERFQVKLVA